ncbi:hypothetical protein DRN44_01745 [Thermococci archaeon]|mgnify:CR=1 FL=1|nr:MAG: hypothetical protein DRN44_01745 [Thermococci archaeon]
MSWRDEKEKIRVQSLRKLVEILEFCKQEHLKYKKNYDLQEFLGEYTWYWYPVSPDSVEEHFGISRRTAQDYLLAIKAIAGLLLEDVERKTAEEEADSDELDEDELWIEEEVLDSLEEERFFLSAIRGESYEVLWPWFCGGGVQGLFRGLLES